jgi:hypothetical protein
MALSAYKCEDCGLVHYRFDDEQEPEGHHKFVKLPPSPKVVLATALYMQEYQLDSWNTTYELDRILNLEARAEKEMSFYQDHIRNR